MKRLKTFWIYILLIIGFWIVSNLIIYLTIYGTYKPVKTEVYINSPQVNVTESKATSINGYIKGNIKNNTEETIKNKYLKIDMYSSRDVNLGTKYVKIEDLKKNENQEFEMWYEFTNVDHVILRITEDAKNISDDALISEQMTLFMFLGKLLFICFTV